MRTRQAFLTVLLCVASLSLRAECRSPELSLSARGLGLYPLGDLGAICYGAAGGSLSLEARNFLVERLSLGLDVDYYGFFPSLDGISSMQNIAGILSAGYRFSLSPSLALTPRLGGGFGAAFTDSSWTSGAGVQAFVVAQAELAWNFAPAWSLGLRLGYRGIGESDTLYSAIEAGLGVSHKLPTSSERNEKK